jgi:hypothetical protein
MLRQAQKCQNGRALKKASSQIFVHVLLNVKRHLNLSNKQGEEIRWEINFGKSKYFWQFLCQNSFVIGAYEIRMNRNYYFINETYIS